MTDLPADYHEERKQRFLDILKSYITREQVDVDASVLVIGASPADCRVLSKAGFRHIVPSNISPEAAGEEDARSGVLAIDVEDIKLEDESFETVIAYEVLHHCRSPHRGLCEMLRVARKHVIFLEPNESLMMRILVRMNMSFPYELPAVIDNKGVRGGVRDTCIPNFLYRWNKREVGKTVASVMPEFKLKTEAHPYWDFTINEHELALRKETKISTITNAIGASNFIKLLKAGEQLLNLFPPLREQGNKFCCFICKTGELQVWLRREAGRIVFAERERA